MTPDGHFWLGSLTATIDGAIGKLKRGYPEDAREDLEQGLGRFMRSRESSDALCSSIENVPTRKEITR